MMDEAGFSTVWMAREAILSGLFTTLAIFLVAALGGVLLGALAAMRPGSFLAPLGWLTALYVELFRNTPLLVQIYVFYKGLPAMGMVLSPLVCGMLALSLQAGAYFAEIFRTGLEAIPREQYDSGRALGFSRVEIIRRIILPQALAIILPSVGNQMTAIVKNTALVSFISVPDLFFVIFKGAADTFQYSTFFIVGIILYMALVSLVGGVFLWLEHRLPVVRLMRLRVMTYA